MIPDSLSSAKADYGSLMTKVGLFVIVLMVSGCEKKVSEYYIVPRGYRGVFMITKSRSADEVKRRDDGSYIYKIPESGVLRVPYSTPLSNWVVSVVAEYDDGEPLAAPVQAELSPVAARLGLHKLSADSEGNYYYFVGTDEELILWWKTCDYRLGGVANRSRDE